MHACLPALRISAHPPACLQCGPRLGGAAAHWLGLSQRTYLGSGKLAELAAELAELKPDTGTPGVSVKWLLPP